MSARRNLGRKDAPAPARLRDLEAELHAQRSDPRGADIPADGKRSVTVSLSGVVTGTAELRHTGAGGPVTTFRIVREDDTASLLILAGEDLAAPCAALTAGTRVVVHAQLRRRSRGDGGHRTEYDAVDVAVSLRPPGETLPGRRPQ